MRFVLAAVLCLAACHDHEHDDYTSYQACFDDHTMEESLPFQQSVVVCCLDHSFNGMQEVCGDTAAACVAYLGTNLTTTATQAEVMAACSEYVTQKGM
jgi:hypothetical protein